jgi:excisionase family DNA binding protein
MEAFMTIPDAARELGLTPAAIRARLRTGAMRGERVRPKLWLIPRDEVERWRVLGRQKRGPKPRTPHLEA